MNVIKGVTNEIFWLLRLLIYRLPQATYQVISSVDGSLSGIRVNGIGAGGRTWTHNILITSEALYLLELHQHASYTLQTKVHHYRCLLQLAVSTN